MIYFLRHVVLWVTYGGFLGILFYLASIGVLRWINGEFSWRAPHLSMLIVLTLSFGPFIIPAALAGEYQPLLIIWFALLVSWFIFCLLAPPSLATGILSVPIAIVIAGIGVSLIFDVTREIELKSEWQIPDGKHLSWSGRHIASEKGGRLVEFKLSPSEYESAYSDELAAYLQAKGQSTEVLKVKLTYQGGLLSSASALIDGRQFPMNNCTAVRLNSAFGVI